MIGRLYGGAHRIDETVDFPVAMEPVRPRSNMMSCFSGFAVQARVLLVERSLDHFRNLVDIV